MPTVSRLSAHTRFYPRETTLSRFLSSTKHLFDAMPCITHRMGNRMPKLSRASQSLSGVPKTPGSRRFINMRCVNQIPCPFRKSVTSEIIIIVPGVLLATYHACDRPSFRLEKESRRSSERALRLRNKPTNHSPTLPTKPPFADSQAREASRNTPFWPSKLSPSPSLSNRTRCPRKFPI
ncbi:hypothetical protein BJX63DRAFT_317383 [Aspergillus granulosus]|uniref:Uncharacterized protein n=1 Tax=Aspergillus granulosus TaxID=176169 RepID=A0ABR4H4I6_9EURO